MSSFFEPGTRRQYHVFENAPGKILIEQIYKEGQGGGYLPLSGGAANTISGDVYLRDSRGLAFTTGGTQGQTWAMLHEDSKLQFYNGIEGIGYYLPDAMPSNLTADMIQLATVDDAQRIVGSALNDVSGSLSNYMPLSGGDITGDINLDVGHWIDVGPEWQKIRLGCADGDSPAFCVDSMDAPEGYLNKYTFTDMDEHEFRPVPPQENETGIMRSGDVYAALSALSAQLVAMIQSN